ncbi:hypothetical protein QCA50_002307 [Cerrena zonata]|uniref:FAS1 domain-containing protein n=1 Tax=Cerrena zonata TaxID=2478898 RepID=A0AAW0GT45_9APHY
MRVQLLSLLALPLLAFSASEEQVVLTNQKMDETYTPATNSQPTLADLLTIESSASIFYSYAREVEISGLFADPNTESTILVPTNKAVMALSHKPHEDPAPSDTGVIISEEEFDARSRKNVERWVSAHIIPGSLTNLESRSYDTLLKDKPVTFKEIDSSATEKWAHFLLNNNVHITSMKEAKNGVLYVIDGTVKLD